jgi:hypothetical protein
MYLVEYKLKLAKDSHGEFSKQHILVQDTIHSVTNYLPELFTDIYDKHRGQYVMGIEVIEVKELDLKMEDSKVCLV